MCRNQIFLIFANNLRYKRNKISPKHASVQIGKQEMCSKLQHKTLNSMVVGARQNFQILRQIPGFSKTIELCLIFYT